MALTTHLNWWINDLEYILDMLKFNILVMIKLDNYIVKMIVIGKHSDYDESITYYIIIISYNHWTQLKIITTNKNNN